MSCTKSWFLALLDFVSRATVVVQASVVRLLTQVSQKPLHGSRPMFVESYLSAIFPDFFLVSKFLIFKLWAITCLAIGQFLKILWHFEILT